VNIKAIIHEDEAGGYWAEIPALPGCVSQGETMEELVVNLREAIEGYLAVDIPTPLPTAKDLILEIPL
jgi:predicted RNase H-like HicB family nuclease